MTLYRGLADVEFVAYLFVTLAVHDLPQHFHFPARQLGRTHSGGQAFGDRAGNQARPRVNFSDGGFEFFKEHVLQQISLGPGLHRAIDIFVAVEGGKNDDARRGKLTALIVPARTETDLEVVFEEIERIRKSAKPHRGFSAKDMIEEGRR